MKKARKRRNRVIVDEEKLHHCNRWQTRGRNTSLNQTVNGKSISDSGGNCVPCVMTSRVNIDVVHY